MNAKTILAGMGINVTIGYPVTGWFAALYSQNIGGYKDPDNVAGHTINPNDGKWYQTPPAPFYGQYGWENPADSQTQVELNVLRHAYQAHNRIENLQPGDGDTNYSFPMDVIQALSPLLGATPDPLIKIIRYVDPLILDLDGDGLEITPLAQGIRFDADGDGIKTGTAWVGTDDGLLAWDRDGNGGIDSGAELFGDETRLADGSKAAHGFAALSELDGNGDGQFDGGDIRYADLRIWRDLNQDGISQANELKSLLESGVQGIHLTGTATDAPR